MMLVGSTGLGKTPPLGFIYKPINEYDDRLHEKYDFSKTQEILGQDMYEGLRILEENMR